MGIRIEVKKLVFESTIMDAIDPQYLGITKEQVKQYLQIADAVGRGMPDDPEYSREDLINDITDSSGFYSLPMNTKPETDDFIATMLNDLI